MRSAQSWARAAFLLAALLLRPACRDEVGQGDQLDEVTVRASITLAGVEPNQPCSHPSVSGDGSLIAFQSAANNLTPNDSNGFIDIFVRNRITGAIENATHVVPIGIYPAWNPADCTEPCISANGRYVAFRSQGDYFKFFQPSPGLSPFVYIWVLDRQDGTFKRGYSGTFFPDADMTDASLSDDGRFLAFASAATNFTPANPGATVQVYITDFLNDTTTLVSRQESGATPTAGICTHPRISGNGQFVTFESDAADLVNPAPPLPAPSMLHVYVGTAAGDPVTLESVAPGGALAIERCTNPRLSTDGRYVAYTCGDLTFFPLALLPVIVRRDRMSGTTELVVDAAGLSPFSVVDGPAFGMSGDGQMFACLLAFSSTVTLNGFVQTFTIPFGGEPRIASVHRDGSMGAGDCFEITLSADGRWPVWSSNASNLVDGDTLGLRDVFTRGPRR